MNSKDQNTFPKMLLAAGIFTLFFVLNCAAVLFTKQDETWFEQIQVGEPAPRDIFAPFSFVLPNEKETTKLRMDFEQDSPELYTVSAKVYEDGTKSVDSFLEALKSARATPTLDLKELAVKYQLKESDLEVFLSVPDLGEYETFFKTVVLEKLKKGIVTDAEKKNLVIKQAKKLVLVDETNQEAVLVPADIPCRSEVLSEVSKQAASAAHGKKEVQNVLIAIASGILKANVNFNEVETQRRKKKILDEMPPIMDLIKKNELLLQQGKIVTPKDFERVQEVGKKLGQRRVLSKVLATSSLVLIAFLIFGVYCCLFEKAIFFNLRSLLLLQSAIFITILLERIAFFMPLDLLYFTLPASLAALLISIFLGFRPALIGTLVVAILTAILSDFRPDIMIVALFGSFAGIYATVGLKKRSQFLKAGALVGVVNFFAIFGYWVLRDVSVRASFHLGTLGLANGFLMSVLVFFLVLIFERTFKVTTDITLLELSDLNHPLLKRMVLEAPGTYHHTLMIANLCEAAAEAIDANALLARVGCYFHDIGKIARSEFFTENEAVKMVEKGVSAESAHEKLSILESTSTIRNHVKEGAELGKKYGLPQVILDFIPQHHGTGVVYYFYKKAMKLQKPGEPAPKEEDFRYPGPKPQSKEAAIALLADSVEASTRSLSDLSPASLRSNVRKIVNDKFIDGQLEECPLALRDMKTIAESFTRTLTGVYHTRIKYPEKDEKQGESKPLTA